MTNQENDKNELEPISALEQLIEGASDFKETTFQDFVLNRFREKADLKHISMLFVANELETIRKNIRLLKKTQRLYEELNRDLASCKTQKDVINLLGEDSVLVAEYLKMKNETK